MIANEVSVCAELLEKKGSSIPLIFEEHESVALDILAIQKLLDETLLGTLSNLDLAYICDWLTLGEDVHFSDEMVQDMISEIGEPEINGGFKFDKDLLQLIDACSIDS